MRNKLVRIYGQKDLRFITFSCYRRQRMLGGVSTRNLFVKVLGEVRRRYEFALVGFVVMPEHVHLLIGEPKKGDPSKVIQALKQSVSRRVRSKSRRKSSPNQLRLGFAVAEKPPHLWQRRFYDFNVYSLRRRSKN